MYFLCQYIAPPIFFSAITPMGFLYFIVTEDTEEGERREEGEGGDGGGGGARDGLEWSE
jgi:hypothetical protein